MSPPFRVRPIPAALLPGVILPAAIVLVGINLRPLLASIGPLLDRIQHDTALGDAGASLLTSLPVLLMGLCLLVTARVRIPLSGRNGGVFGLTIIALACLLRWAAPTIPALVASAVLGGLGIALVQALMPAIIRGWLGTRAAGMMGLYSTAIMGGAALASFAAPRIASAQGWPAASGVWALPAIAALIVWWIAAPAAGALADQRGNPAIWRSRRAWLLLAFFGLGTGGYTLVLAWLPPYYTRLGWSPEAAGALLAALTLAEVAAGIAVSLVADRMRDRRPMIHLAVGALFAGMMCLCLAPLPAAWAAALLAGLGIGALFPLGLIVAMDHAADGAEAGDIAAFVQGGGYVLAATLPFAAGLLRQHLSDLRPAWWLMAVLCAVLALIATRLRPEDRISLPQ